MTKHEGGCIPRNVGKSLRASQCSAVIVLVIN